MPKVLFCDNGSEFTSQAMDLWAYQNGMKIDFSRPGKPTDNAFVESFNGTFRAECLNAHWFGSEPEPGIPIATVPHAATQQDYRRGDTVSHQRLDAGFR